MKEALREYGLSDNEANVYLAVLKLGESPVTDIANKANTYRTLTYEVLKSLEDKGLVSSVIRDKKKHFIVASPEKLLQGLKEKERRIQEIMPDLLSIHKSVSIKPTMTVYSGTEGIKNIFQDILNVGEDFIAIASVEQVRSKIDFMFKHFILKRVELKMKAKLIIDKEPLTKELTEYKVMDFSVPTLLYVYANKVAVINVGTELVGMIIESEDYAKTQKMMFDWMWNTAKSKP
ncbi:hypothetical protein HN419_03180 [Candidatus Woesearchaeota archaeon]|jgi:HTH-type transcriptional regulator, sugar sensing transcriptional regulator|nr:hypothetical protein [Candidatus Woesearchaeota archaeon]MBT3537000.1 hypothetical protein [Candidatus Woesearchaeota archaeon]MBT4697610.1 hypothetical protein [Candidatus Woesearchaeota archaeon]MBT4717724.1 hypothetical protein [Candidatus Woesearchaeota archaeon]MBT7106690.1 hypothetical protein [Candidatus Woesearchaeota archaeon]